MTGRPVPGDPELVAVTATVKGSPAQVVRFAARNLRAGADHVVVFVDDADPDVLRALAEDAEVAGRVTAIGTDEPYWRGADEETGQRPDNLNRRQNINANLANALVSSVPRFGWLFHLDLDERLHLDRERLLALDPGVRALELATWEAVSTEDGAVPARYKRRPTPEEVAELQRRGLAARASLHGYFRGHIAKVGIRPDPRVRLRIHHAMEPGGKVLIEPLRTDWSQVLHDESDSYDEFVRKWRTLLTAGGFGQKPLRERFAQLVSAVLTDDGLDPAEREARLRRLYRDHVADDVDTLEELGLLADPDPRWSDHRPVELAEEERQALRGVAGLLMAADKRFFRRSGPPAEQLLERLHRRQQRPGADPSVVAGLEAALTRAGTRAGTRAAHPPSRPS